MRWATRVRYVVHFDTSDGSSPCFKCDSLFSRLYKINMNIPLLSDLPMKNWGQGSRHESYLDYSL